MIHKRNSYLPPSPRRRRRANEPRLNNSRPTPMPQRRSFRSDLMPRPSLLPSPALNEGNPYAARTIRHYERKLELIGSGSGIEGATGGRSGQSEHGKAAVLEFGSVEAAATAAFPVCGRFGEVIGGGGGGGEVGGLEDGWGLCDAECESCGQGSQ